MRFSAARIGIMTQEGLAQACTRFCTTVIINGESENGSTAERATIVQKELDALQSYPGEIGCFELFEYKVDKQFTICVKSNHYSVPDNMVGETVIVQMYSEKIVIFNSAHKKIGRHIRSYGTNEWIVDINHYISTLMKKTSAIQYSEAFHQMPMSMQVIYHKYFKDNGKEFLQLVKYVRDNDIAYEEVVDDLFLQYIVVGGMPEAVGTFLQNHDIGQVLQVQRNIVDEYKDDMVKYADEVKSTTGNIKSTKTILKNKNVYHVNSAIKLGKYNIGRDGETLTLPLYMAFLLTAY